MEREEIEAMWERIKTLEENSLKVSKKLALQSMYAIVGIMSARSALGGKHTSFTTYMTPKANEAVEQITRAGNVDEVIKIIEQFTSDCIKFTMALSK